MFLKLNDSSLNLTHLQTWSDDESCDHCVMGIITVYNVRYRYFIINDTWKKFNPNICLIDLFLKSFFSFFVVNFFLLLCLQQLSESTNEWVNIVILRMKWIFLEFILIFLSVFVINKILIILIELWNLLLSTIFPNLDISFHF